MRTGGDKKRPEPPIKAEPVQAVSKIRFSIDEMNLIRYHVDNVENAHETKLWGKHKSKKPIKKIAKSGFVGTHVGTIKK